MWVTPLRIAVPGAEQTVSGDLTLDDDSTRLLVLAHGAGAGYRHASMLAISEALARRGVGTLRFNFPFTEAGRRRVDGQALSVATILAALDAAGAAAPDVPLFLGGHSYGGRMASHAAVEHSLPVRGLVFCSFPLHPAKKPGVTRAAHLRDVPLPMLFLSGTRDALARRDLLEGVLAGLGARAHAHWLETADHGYRVLKRTRTRDQDVFDELAEAAAAFLDLASPAGRCV